MRCTDARKAPRPASEEGDAAGRRERHASPLRRFAGWVLPWLLLFPGCRSRSPLPSQSRDAAYVGASRCASCHVEETARWNRSAHGNHAFIASPRVVKGDFDLKNVYVHQGVTSRMWEKDGKYFMETEGPAGTPETYPIDIALGWRQTQVYLTLFPDGRYQVLPTYYDLEEKLWYDQTEGVVPSGGKKLTPEARSFWANRGRTWNSGCSGCHGSQVEKHFDISKGVYETTWIDLTINCESCHGPGSRHVEAWSKAGSVGTEEGRLVKIGSLSSQRQVETCAKCHAAKTTLARGFRPGDDFLEYYEPIVPSNGNQFFSDGRNKGLNYNYIAHIQSRCYTEGGLTCTGCHDPHGSENGVDLKEPPSRLNELCLPCHADKQPGPEGHTHHEANAVQCMDCHMPFVDILGRRLQARDHSISVPAPAITKSFGAPNACNTCHRDKDPGWAAEAIQRWFHDDQQDRVRKAAAFFYGFRRDPSAAPALLELFKDRKALSMPRRAGIAQILATYQDASLLAPLVGAMLDPKEEPLVRYQIASAMASVPSPLTDQALLKVVTRPERAMRRVAGATLARRGVRPRSPEIQAAIDEVVKEYEAVVKDVRSDVPEDHANLGDIYLRRGKEDDALEQYRLALKLDKDLPEVQIQMGTLLARRNQTEDAARHFLAAAELLPNSPVPRFDLGVLYLQVGRRPEAIAELSRALEIDPQHTGAVLELAIAQIDSGSPRPAAESLERFLATHPRQAEAQYQLGRALEALGDKERARDAYRRALALAPQLQESREALARLGG